jgi:hypothetical protein
VTKVLRAFLAAALVLGPASAVTAADPPGKWVPMFGGRDLSGWTPKFTGSPAGENVLRTFRWEDGVLTVSYDGYDELRGRFGHLFYDRKLSHYRIRLEYRFTGRQVAGSPPWGLMNSGIMLHSESAHSMRRDQAFPVSVEAQFLGDDGTGKRTTGNLCSPGTHVVIGGTLRTEHCPQTSQVAVAPGEWTRFEVEVRGSRSIRHLVNGVVTAEYTAPQYDPTDEDGRRVMGSGPIQLGEGYVALQAESHPVQFRKVELLVLEP